MSFLDAFCTIMQSVSCHFLVFTADAHQRYMVTMHQITEMVGSHINIVNCVA